MKSEKILLAMLWTEALGFLVLSAGIFLYDSPGNVSYEFFGALFALMLTTLGLFEMRRLT